MVISKQERLSARPVWFRSKEKRARVVLLYCATQPMTFEMPDSSLSIAEFRVIKLGMISVDIDQTYL